MAVQSLFSLCLAYVIAIVQATTLIDLTRTFNDKEPSYPGLKKFELISIAKGFNKYGIWTEVNDFCSSEFTGTHIDAPAHKSKTGWHLNEIPLQRLWRRPGIVIDVTAQAESHKNYQIQVRDLERYETSYGVIPNGAIVLFNTGWGKYADNATVYTGIDENKILNFPGISVDAARWLANHGFQHEHDDGIVGVGIDTLSLDYGPSIKFKSHVILLGNNVYGLQNLANVHLLPPNGFTVTVLPTKIKEGSGGPARVVAETDPDAECGPLKVESAAATWSREAILATAIPLVLALKTY